MGGPKLDKSSAFMDFIITATTMVDWTYWALDRDRLPLCDQAVISLELVTIRAASISRLLAVTASSMRPWRIQNDVADVPTLESRVLERNEVVVEGAKRRRGTILQALVEGVDNAPLEAVVARIGRNHRLTLFVRE